MATLTSAQLTILNCCGSVGIRDAVKSGELPDSVEVNARIAKRCLWENPTSWNFGPWFVCDYVNAQFRSGRVSVRRYTTPDEDVRFTVVAPNGRWCDSLTLEEATKHLRSRRVNGQLVLLTEKEVEQAESDHNWALSR